MVGGGGGGRWWCKPIIVSNPTFVELFWGCVVVVLWLSCGFDNFFSFQMATVWTMDLTNHILACDAR